jgi:hypothetical protein
MRRATVGDKVNSKVKDKAGARVRAKDEVRDARARG